MTTKPRMLPVIYIGNGAQFIGVPARDMSLEEWELLPAELREQAKSLYKFSVEKEDEGK